ncbi:MAG: SDR family NAD(P)-dependent oxidoreductase [Alphaproteobacteria bacterium]|nr:SDR family NAD(P)-dependent oxidoreductase [Alphaproteobacteria bacterium]
MAKVSKTQPIEPSGTAFIVGVGPGLGAALARRFANARMNVGLAARKKSHLQPLAKEINNYMTIKARAFGCDSTKAKDVDKFFEAAVEELGEPDLVVYNAGAFVRASVLDIAPEDFEHCWRVGCYGGFLVGQAAARRMAHRGKGTIIFTGATASIRGGANFVNLASPKFGLRAVAQSLARELGPQNVHVAHAIIDGQILSDKYAHLQKERGPESLLAPEAIAETYFQLHHQARSAWTHELDLRPWVEKF